LIERVEPWVFAVLKTRLPFESIAPMRSSAGPAISRTKVARVSTGAAEVVDEDSSVTEVAGTAIVVESLTVRVVSGAASDEEDVSTGTTPVVESETVTSRVVESDTVVATVVSAAVVEELAGITRVVESETVVRVSGPASDAEETVEEDSPGTTRVVESDTVTSKVVLSTTVVVTAVDVLLVRGARTEVEEVTESVVKLLGSTAEVAVVVVVVVRRVVEDFGHLVGLSFLVMVLVEVHFFLLT
jgi:hypothetical protein